MRDDVFDVDPLVDKLDKGNNSQVITTNIENPPFITIVEVIQRRKNSSQLRGAVEVVSPKNLVHQQQRQSIVGIFNRRLAERPFGDDMHTASYVMQS
jgi:hypothetical protein